VVLDSVTRRPDAGQVSQAQATAIVTARARVARDNGEADPMDAMTHGAAVTVERLAGIMLISFGLIYLVLLGDISLSAFFARTLFTAALVMRILVLGAVFTSAVLFGLLLNRPSR
jgi:hypothetical protein